MTTVKGIEQGRADYAYKCVLKGEQLNKSSKVDVAYKSYTRKIPTLIKVNGLGATFAFILSKSKKEETSKGFAYKLIYEQVDNWLRAETHGTFENIFKFIPKKRIVNGKEELVELVEALIQLNSSEYRAVTNEVITLFGWLKRFSEGLIDGEEISNE